TNPITLTVTLTNLTTNFVTSVTPWITSSTLSLAAQSPLNVSNSVFVYTLPALSVVTFVGQTTSNSAPVLTPLTNQTMDAGTVLTLTNVATDPNAPPQTLAFNLLNAPTGATVNSSNGIFSWRAPVGYANTTNPVAVRVADNAPQPLSATNNFTIRVNPITTQVAGAVVFDGVQ